MRHVGDEAEEFKRFEAEGWGRKAESYASLTGALTTRVVEPLLDAAGGGRGSARPRSSPPARATSRRRRSTGGPSRSGSTSPRA